MPNATLDPTTDAPPTVRVVFDGAPFAGKTTAAHALAEALGGHVSTPDPEVHGRTLWFDWMTYGAGSHNGRPLRIELVTVPGQDHLASRREHLIGWGDAVIFVADTSNLMFAESVQRFGELRRTLTSRPSTPVIVIANKRDLPDAVSLERVRHELGMRDVEVLIEGVATTGGGVQQAFVHAVHAALQQSPARVDATAPEDLLAALRLLPTAPSHPVAPESAAFLPPQRAVAEPPQTVDHDGAAPGRLEAGDAALPADGAERDDADMPAPAAATDLLPADEAAPAGEMAAEAAPASEADEDDAVAVVAAAEVAPTTAEPPKPERLHEFVGETRLQLNPDAIADGDAVMVLDAHWRVLVDIAEGETIPGHDDHHGPIRDLLTWGLIVAEPIDEAGEAEGATATDAHADASRADVDASLPVPPPFVEPSHQTVRF